MKGDSWTAKAPHTKARKRERGRGPHLHGEGVKQKGGGGGGGRNPAVTRPSKKRDLYTGVKTPPKGGPPKRPRRIGEVTTTPHPARATTSQPRGAAPRRGHYGLTVTRRNPTLQHACYAKQARGRAVADAAVRRARRLFFRDAG